MSIFAPLCCAGANRGWSPEHSAGSPSHPAPSSSIRVKAVAAKISGCCLRNNMFSRSAQGLYWISRYLERAQHSCRLLANQFESLEDQPAEEIDQSWRRIYTGLGRSPMGGD